jgi:hypothetical protein
METVEIEEALTRKANGDVLQVDRTQIFAQAPPGSPQVPILTDRKQKVRFTHLYEGVGRNCRAAACTAASSATFCPPA